MGGCNQMQHLDLQSNTLPLRYTHHIIYRTPNTGVKTLWSVAVLSMHFIISTTITSVAKSIWFGHYSNSLLAVKGILVNWLVEEGFEV